MDQLCLLSNHLIQILTRSGQLGYNYVNPAFGVIRDEPLVGGEAQHARGNGLYQRQPHEHPAPYAPPPRSSSLIQNFANSPGTTHKDSQVNLLISGGEKF